MKIQKYIIFFFDFFEKTYHFQITDYIKNAESDQGTGLAKCIKNQGMKHLKCLRHLLVSLGKGCFSEQIGNLVSVTSKFDFKELKKEYNSSWRELTDAKMIAKLERNLNKVGLTFQNQQKIKVKDDEKWDERSMNRISTIITVIKTKLKTHVHILQRTLCEA